jgi:hypothetical protein
MPMVVAGVDDGEDDVDDANSDEVFDFNIEDYVLDGDYDDSDEDDEEDGNDKDDDSDDDEERHEHATGFLSMGIEYNNNDKEDKQYRGLN